MELVSTTIVVVTVFTFGIVVGLLVSLELDGFDSGDLKLVVGALVTVMWAISIVSEIVIPTYTVSVLIHGIMGAVVGYLFSDDGLTLNIGNRDN